jgi:hypothetical protein
MTKMKKALKLKFFKGKIEQIESLKSIRGVIERNHKIN